MLVRTLIIFVFGFMFMLNLKVILKADEIKDDYALKAGETFNWNDITVQVQKENFAKGLTFKMRNNTLTIAADRPGPGTPPAFNNVLFDGGCITGGESCLGVTLDMDQSNFRLTAGANSGNRVRVENRVIFNIKNGSNFTAPLLTAKDGGVTDFYLKITNSNFIVDKIDFTNGKDGNGYIREITIKNKSKDDKKVTTINGSQSTQSNSNNFIAIDIGGGYLNYINLENAVFDVGGDIIAKAGIGEIKLNNSSFLFKGLVINQLNDNIILDKGSVFERKKRTGEGESLKAKMYIASKSSKIEVNDKSEFSWDDIAYDFYAGAKVDVRATGESKIKLNDVTYYYGHGKPESEKERLEFTLQATTKSEVTINSIDFVGKWKADDKNLFEITGDGTSTYNINNLSFNDNNVIIRFWDKKINLKNFNYGGDNLVLNAKDDNGNVKNDGELKIETVNFAPIEVYTEQTKDINGNDIEGKENEIRTLVLFGECKGEGDKKVCNKTPLEKGTFNLNDFKINFGKLNVAADDFILNANNSSGKIGDINFQGETGSDFTFRGNGNSNFEINNINAGNAKDKNGIAKFDSIKIKVNNDFNYSGNIKATTSNLDVKALKGNLSNIYLENSTLSLGEGSNFTFDTININGSSSLNINGDNSIASNDKGVINNSGTLNVNAINNFNTIENHGNLNFNQGNSSVVNLNNTGHVQFYSQNNIGTLSSSAGSLNFYNTTSVDTLDVKNTDFNFYINTKKDYGRLDVKNEVDISGENFEKEGIKVKFNDTSIFKPGRYNRFDFISAKSINVSEDALKDTFAIAPVWIRADCFNEEVDEDVEENHKAICKREVKDGKIVGEKGEESKASMAEDFNGEIMQTNIIRLTSYKKIMESIPDYINDKEAMLMAETIDNIIDKEDVVDNMVDVVNSLDLNSGCSVNADEGSLAEAHNDKDANITFEKYNCLGILGNNIKKLKAINNSVFLNSSHTNLMDAEAVLASSNKEYYGRGESLTWVKSNLNYNILQNKNYVTGYNKINNTLQIGYSSNVVNNINVSASVGILGGLINGKQDLYNSMEFGSNIGFAIAYNSRDEKSNFYIGATSLYGFNMYSNTRNIDFMNNQYSLNRDTKADSLVLTSEVMGKLETGYIFNYDEQLFKIFKDATLFINPHISGLVAGIWGSPYKEKGSSASLEVSGFNNLITEIAIGADIYQEVLLENFLYQDYAFWTPKASFNLIKRNYGDVSTNYKFLGHPDEYMIYSNQSVYDAPLIAQTKISLDMLKDNITVGVAYKLDVAFNSFVNNSIQATAKYSF